MATAAEATTVVEGITVGDFITVAKSFSAIPIMIRFITGTAFRTTGIMVAITELSPSTETLRPQ
jgi:hypothetical protein